MNDTLEEKVIYAYTDGSSVQTIAESYSLTTLQISLILHGYRDSQRSKRAFSEEFKQMIAERDLSGASRTLIAQELGININTVKKSCEAYGQNFKERATSDNMYTKIEGDFPTDTCVGCKSDHYNLVEDNTHYCWSCGKEYIHKEGHVLQVNWEYVD